MAKAVAPSTLKAYSHALSLFNLFCISMHVSVFQCRPLLRIPQTKMVFYQQKLVWYSIYARCQDSGFPSSFSAPAIRLLPKGISKSLTRVPDKRSPITLDILNRYVCSLITGLFHLYLNVLHETVFFTAFYGFMCPGEYTSPTQIFFPTRGLAFADITFSPRHFSIFLKRSKSVAQEQV